VLIADSQIHIWKTGDPRSKVIQPPYPPLSHASFSKDDALREMDMAGVRRAVLVPPGWDLVNELDGHNIASLEAARLHPDRFAVAGLLPVTTPEARVMVKGWLNRPGMKAMRVTFTSSGNRLGDGSAEWLWPIAERDNIPIMIRTTNEISLVGDLAERYPGIKFAIDHMAMAHFKKDDEAFIYIPQLLALTKWPNITIKASAIPVYTSHPYPYNNVHRYIRQVYDAFGPDRMFWGSDLTRLTDSYRRCVTLFTEELPWLSDHDKQKIMGQTLCRWLSWDV
jgi:predicted TIM-barrel fold metal-dependent hydrolase